jgi:DNA-binding NtrC family response regulator
MEVLHCVLADEALTTETLDRVTAAARLNETSRVAIASKNKSAPLLLLLDIDKLPAASLVVVGDFLRHQAHACRIIATSEQPLVHLAATGEFPASLAHQISTLEINLLSLSQRGEDIPLLAQAFVEHANRVSDQQLSGFDASAMSMLTEFHWPGNFEQLQLVVASTCERAASRPGATSIKTNDFPDSFRHAIKAARIGRPEEAIIDLQQWLDELEKELIQRALGQAGGNKTKAAQLLTMTRSRLVRRVDHLQLPQVPPQTDAKEMIDSSAFEELD